MIIVPRSGSGFRLRELDSGTCFQEDPGTCRDGRGGGRAFVSCRDAQTTFAARDWAFWGGGGKNDPARAAFPRGPQVHSPPGSSPSLKKKPSQSPLNSFCRRTRATIVNDDIMFTKSWIRRGEFAAIFSGLSRPRRSPSPSSKHTRFYLYCYSPVAGSSPSSLRPFVWPLPKSQEFLRSRSSWGLNILLFFTTRHLPQAVVQRSARQFRSSAGRSSAPGGRTLKGFSAARARQAILARLGVDSGLFGGPTAFPVNLPTNRSLG